MQRCLNYGTTKRRTLALHTMRLTFLLLVLCASPGMWSHLASLDARGEENHSPCLHSYVDISRMKSIKVKVNERRTVPDFRIVSHAHEPAEKRGADGWVYSFGRMSFWGACFGFGWEVIPVFGDNEAPKGIDSYGWLLCADRDLSDQGIH